MLRKFLCIFIFAALITPVSAFAASRESEVPAYMRDEIYASKAGDFERGAVLYLKDQRPASNKGEDVNSRQATRQDQGLVLPDGRGGIIIIPGTGEAGQSPNIIDARELKLKLRELAAQLVTGLPASLSGNIALPTSFVQQDDFERSSSFGRFVAEQLYYEFNQRGLRTKEYRMGQILTVREDGEFILTRNVSDMPLAPNTLYVVGTYFTDGHVLFLNARLLRSNGDILRTGQLIMQLNQLTKRMLANSGRRMQEGSLEVKDFKTEARPPETTTAFDRGLDVH